MLKANKIVFSYHIREKEIKALKGVSLQLQKGEIVACTGPSGSGKTTLLKALYGLIDVAEGTIFADEKEVLGPSYHLIPGQERMSLVQQDFGLLLKHSVYDNLEPLLRHLTEAEKHKEIMQMLRMVRLERFKEHLPEELSGGQQQRLAIARAFLNDPDYLLLDEPFSQLDQELQQRFIDYVSQKVNQQDWGVLYTTHDPVEALSKADKIIFLHLGKLVQLATPKEIFFRPKNKVIAAHFGEFNLTKTDVFKGFAIENAHKIENYVFSRPSQWKVNENSSLEFVVKRVEFRGNHQYVHLKNELTDLIVSVPTEKRIEVGQKLRVAPNFELV